MTNKHETTHPTPRQSFPCEHKTTRQNHITPIITHEALPILDSQHQHAAQVRPHTTKERDAGLHVWSRNMPLTLTGVVVRGFISLRFLPSGSAKKHPYALQAGGVYQWQFCTCLSQMGTNDLRISCTFKCAYHWTHTPGQERARCHVQNRKSHVATHVVGAITHVLHE